MYRYVVFMTGKEDSHIQQKHKCTELDRIPAISRGVHMLSY